MSTEQLPEGLKLAVNALEWHAESRDEYKVEIDAMRAEHAQRVTLQHHACDQAQRIAELEAERDEVEEDRDELRNTCDKQLLRIADLERLSEMHKNAWLSVDPLCQCLQVLIVDGVVKIEADARFSEVAVAEIGKMLTKIARLEAKVDTLKRLHDAVKDERDALRAKLAEIGGQEPVAEIRTWHKSGEQHADLLDWCDSLENLPDGTHKLYAQPVPALSDMWHPLETAPKVQETSSEWIEWYGGACPIGISRCHVRFRNGGEWKVDFASDLNWQHKGVAGDVVAYRVLP